MSADPKDTTAVGNRPPRWCPPLSSFAPPQMDEEEDGKRNGALVSYRTAAGMGEGVE